MSTKRLPFNEAPHDLSNRSTSTSAATASEDDGSNPIKSVMIGNMRRRVERGKELKGGGRVGRALNNTTGGKATLAVNSKNKPTSAVNSRADAKTRQLKAQAYSDKITIASQTQRIEALQAELEEVRQFASMEAEWRSGDRHQVGGSAKDGESKDGELIEALAQELENTEKDLKVAQEAVGRLEMELMEERNKNSIVAANNNNAQISSVKSTSTATTQSTTSTLTPHSATYSAAHVSIEELHNIVSAQKIQLQKSQQDAAEGLSIMRDLEKALRVARSERDAARMKRDEAQMTAQRLEGELEGVAEERDGVRAELEGVRAAFTQVRAELSKSEEMRARLQSANKKQSEEYASLVGRYGTLENSLSELQSVLSVVQTRSEKKIAALHTALSAAEDREEKSALELSALSAKYKDVQGQCGEMEGVLTDLTERFQEVKSELTSKKEELEGLDKRYVGEMERMKALHGEEMERAREEARVLYGAMLAKKEAEWEAKMKNVREEEAKSRDEGFKVTEEEWRLKYKAEMEEWKLKLEKAQEEAKSALVEREELSRCQSENAKLKTEKNELLKKLERGMAMYNETALQLKAAKTAAAGTCNSKGGDAELLAANKALKKDLTTAVESSISRGRQIQSLEKEVESYRVQLTKASQTIKRMEKSTPNSVTPVVNTDADEIHRLESEVKALKSRAQEAETQKQQLQDDISEISVLKLKASKVDSLEKDLQTSHLALTESQSRILSLQEALKATESALRAVSSTRLKGTPGSPKDDLRRQIEDLALKDYVGRRM